MSRAKYVACGKIEQATEQAGERRSAPGVSKKLGRSGKGVSEKGEGVGRKGIACSQSQTFNRTPFAPERGIAKNAYCSRDIYLQLERSVITLVIIHGTQKKLIHWLL